MVADYLHQPRCPSWGVRGWVRLRSPWAWWSALWAGTQLLRATGAPEVSVGELTPLPLDAAANLPHGNLPS